MGSGLFFPSPQLLAAHCPASFGTLNVTSSEACLTSLCRQSTPLSPPLQSTNEDWKLSHMCIRVSPTGTQAPQGQSPSPPSPPPECKVCQPLPVRLLTE